jgi:hypothetical protein
MRSIVVDSDTTGVDTATIVIEGSRTSTFSLGDPVAIEGTGGGASKTAVFKGEVTSIEPDFSTGTPLVTMRSFTPARPLRASSRR